MTVEDIKEINPDALLYVGFDEAIIGIAERINLRCVAVYDVSKILSILIDDGMTYNEAEEYYNLNILGAWMGDNTPVYVRTKN
jgi:hypothetical protein